MGEDAAEEWVVGVGGGEEAGAEGGFVVFCARVSGVAWVCGWECEWKGAVPIGALEPSLLIMYDISQSWRRPLWQVSLVRMMSGRATYSRPSNQVMTCPPAPYMEKHLLCESIKSFNSGSARMASVGMSVRIVLNGCLIRTPGSLKVWRTMDCGCQRGSFFLDLDLKFEGKG